MITASTRAPARTTDLPDEGVRSVTADTRHPAVALLSNGRYGVMITAAGAASHSSLVLGSAERVAATLRRSGATMPDDELSTVAELMLRVAWTYLLNPRGGLDVADEGAVRDYARRYLAPLVH